MHIIEPMPLVQSSDIYPKGRNKCKYYYSISVRQFGAANIILKNVQWPNIGVKVSSTSMLENFFCLHTTKELEWVNKKDKS